jgi:predicted nucleic acid-binding protein
MILADTTIWIDFFRSGACRSEMGMLVYNHQLVMHPYVIAELALGSLQNRRETLANLDCLPKILPVSLADVRLMIEARGMYAKGIGLTDAHLVASCLATPGTQLWTLDGRLGKVAESVGLRADLPHA